MIQVTQRIKDGIDWIWRAGNYNPYDWPRLATILAASTFTESAEWINENPVQYIKGIDEGFVVVTEVENNHEEDEWWQKNVVSRYERFF